MTVRPGSDPATAEDLEVVWRSVADDFPLVDPEDSGSAALARLVGDLVTLFEELRVPGQLALPADYARFLELAGGGRQFGSYWGVYLFGPATAWSNTNTSCRLFAERRPVDATMWVSIGQSGDRHGYTLCCDRTDARFGVVYDGDDDHPWHDGKGLTERAASFTDFLASFRS